MNKIVAISGKATSGKTAAARIFNAIYNHPTTIESFAAPLKEIVRTQFSYAVTAEDLIHHKNKVIRLGSRETTVRQLMIDVGKMFRAIDEDFWVKKLIQRIQISESNLGPSVFIDDMRFPNEHKILKDMGATLIRIERPGIPLIDDESETGLDNHQFDYVIRNDGTLMDLAASISDLVNTKG